MALRNAFKALQITPKVHWIGAIDWGLKDFHGYTTHRGSTYNAYLITGEKNILIDTVKKPFFHEMVRRISSVISDPKNIDYIISNHSEMDHSGCLPEMIELCKPDVVFASKIGYKTLQEHFDFPEDFKKNHLKFVESGETLEFNNDKIKFIETKGLHWPDSMVSYLEGEKILFSNDCFGMHLATDRAFTDEISQEVIEQEAKTYYANILTCYSHLVEKTVDTLEKMNLPIDIVAPDHGPMWRGENIKTIMDWYKKWAKQEPTNKAVVFYSTMWGSTELMAKAIANGIHSCGVQVSLMPQEKYARSDIVTELLDAGAVVIGCPTMNNQLFPTTADVLCYIKGLKFKNKVAGTFTSFGWSGESLKYLNKFVEEMKDCNWEKVGNGVRAKYVPKDKNLQDCYDYGVQIGEKLKSVLKQ